MKLYKHKSGIYYTFEAARSVCANTPGFRYEDFTRIDVSDAVYRIKSVHHIQTLEDVCENWLKRENSSKVLK